MKIYKFYANWCNPCKMLTKTIEESDIKDLITPINVSEDEDDLCSKYNISSIPVLVFTKDNGEVLEKLIGPKPISEIKKVIEKYANN